MEYLTKAVEIRQELLVALRSSTPRSRTRARKALFGDSADVRPVLGRVTSTAGPAGEPTTVWTSPTASANRSWRSPTNSWSGRSWRLGSDSGFLHHPDGIRSAYGHSNRTYGRRRAARIRGGPGGPDRGGGQPWLFHRTAAASGDMGDRRLQARHVVLGVEPEATRRAVGGHHQADPVLVADRPQRQSDAVGLLRVARRPGHR